MTLRPHCLLAAALFPCLSDASLVAAGRPNVILTVADGQGYGDFSCDGDGKVSEAEYPDLEIHTVLAFHRPGSPAYESLVARLPKR